MRQIHLALLRFAPTPLVRAIEGFWSTPLLISLFGIALSIAIQLVPEEQLGFSLRQSLGEIDADGARGALSVIAGGMVSLVALVFSLTFVALSITAQQLSPRILDFVVRERAAQVLLGLALTTFLFSTITLTLGEVRGAWRIGLATPVALILAAATLVMVVAFAHGMTRVMRADEMVARLGNTLVDGMQVLLQPPPGCSIAEDDSAELERELENGEQVLAQSAGYVGVIDYQALIRLAADENIRIALDVRESDFLLPQSGIARVIGLHSSDRKPVRKIEMALNLSDRREASDTAGYEAAALCEAALRSLSPGINDPATAMSCLNRLFEGLASLAGADAPPPRFLASGANGDDRVALLVRLPRDVPEFILNTIDPVVAAARNDERVLSHIAALARNLLLVARRPRVRSAIERLLGELGEASNGLQ